MVVEGGTFKPRRRGRKTPRANRSQLPESGSGKAEQQEAVTGKREAASGQREAGSGKQEAGSRKRAAGSGKREAGIRRSCLASSFFPRRPAISCGRSTTRRRVSG